MPLIRLMNGSNKTIKAGTNVKIHATKKDSFDIASLGDVVIGTTQKRVSSGNWCVINPVVIPKIEDIIKEIRPLVPRITIGDVEPVNPSVNDIWIDTSE